MQILGDNGPLAIPEADKIEIGRDGTISIIPIGDNASTLVEVGRIKLVKPNLKDLEKLNDGLLTLKPNIPVPEADASVALVQGALESSNVNTIEALVEMIELSRNFELQVKVMKETDENNGTSAKLMQLA